MYSTEDNHLALIIAGFEMLLMENPPQVVTKSEIQLSGTHFGTSFDNSTKVYNYYRHNDTHLAELLFDMNNGHWEPPTFFFM